MQLDKHRQRMEVQYQKKIGVQDVVVGQCIELLIPVVAREKLDDKFISCRGIKLSGYSPRCEEGDPRCNCHSLADVVGVSPCIQLCC